MPHTERMDGESQRAHKARITYLEMGADRSIRKVAALVRCSISSAGGWSRRFCWTAQAAEYDADIARARHDSVVAGNVVQARENAGLVEVVDAAQLREMVFGRISSRVDELLDGLMGLATGATSTPQVQLSAIKHALALVGVTPVKRIEQRTELSGSLGVDASVVDVAEADLEAILEAMPMETLRALDDAYHDSAGDDGEGGKLPH